MRTQQRFALVWLLVLVAIGTGSVYLSHAAGQPAYIFLLPAGLSLLLYATFYLNLDVSAAGVEFQLTPFFRRSYPWHTITSAEAIRYKPLLDFGGWGFRYSFTKKAWAYSISGSWALKLELTSGKSVYIGIKEADADKLAQVIATHKQQP